MYYTAMVYVYLRNLFYHRNNGRILRVYHSHKFTWH